jgi:hypothetical protein
MQSNYCVQATCHGAVKDGLKVVLAAGAHATYDESEKADRISIRVEEELRPESVRIIPFREIDFAEPLRPLQHPQA